MAKIAIEREFGIQTFRQFHAEHLYELAGIRELFGSALVERIKSGEVFPTADVPVPSVLSLRLRDHQTFDLLESMNASVLSVVNGVVGLQLVSRDGRFAARAWLNFAEERFQFDGIHDVEFRDDGSTEAAQSLLEWAEFSKPYFCNGTVELWDAAAKTRLARAQPYLPVNMRFSPEEHAACVQKLRERASL